MHRPSRTAPLWEVVMPSRDKASAAIMAIMASSAMLGVTRFTHHPVRSVGAYPSYAQPFAFSLPRSSGRLVPLLSERSLRLNSHTFPCIRPRMILRTWAPRKQGILQSSAEAIMDVNSFSPMGVGFLLDASFRNLLAKGYALAAFARPSFAASCGEQDKRPWPMPYPRTWPRP